MNFDLTFEGLVIATSCVANILTAVKSKWGLSMFTRTIIAICGSVAVFTNLTANDVVSQAYGNPAKALILASGVLNILAAASDYHLITAYRWTCVLFACFAGYYGIDLLWKAFMYF